MKEMLNISYGQLTAAYLLLLFPFGIMLFHRMTLLRQTVLAILRMTVQLLFVGFYLQVVFRLNNPWLNLAWLMVMVAVADGSIIRGCGLQVRRFLAPMFLALVIGTLIPVIVFMGPVLRRPNWLDAQYVIPLWGMILGNCLRADIIGLKNFYEAIARNERRYHFSLTQGARLQEAIEPYCHDAIQSALLPTIATMTTIGLVSLPGMMTGVILAGAQPMTAIKYQIAIMIAIFSGTALTVFLGIRLTLRTSFDAYGLLDERIFTRPFKG